MKELVYLDFDKPVYEEKEMPLLGKTVVVKKDIPYADKVRMAAELAITCVVRDGEKPIAAVSANEQVMTMKFILAYYTNANVEGMAIDKLYDLFDMLYNTAEYMAIYKYIVRSWSVVEKIYSNICDMLMKRVEKPASVDMLGMFGADMNAEKSIAEANEFREWFTGVLDQANEGARMKENGKLPGLKEMLDNGVISFSKKKV